MKASELIEELKKQIKEHGDKEVRFVHCDPLGPCCGTETIESVEWNNADDVDDVIVLWY